MYLHMRTGSCPDTRRSILGFCLFWGILSFLGDQRSKALCPILLLRLDICSMAQATCEVVWFDVLLSDFGIKRTKVVPLFCDNKAAVYLTSNLAFHERTKHIEVDCHTIRERYTSGLIKPMHISAKLQIADIFTKALPLPVFARLVSEMGLRDIHFHLERLGFTPPPNLKKIK